jgi:hypothetical protein
MLRIERGKHAPKRVVRNSVHDRQVAPQPRWLCHSHICITNQLSAPERIAGCAITSISVESWAGVRLHGSRKSPIGPSIMRFHCF